METLKRVVRNEYFPAAAVLALVVLFWVAGLFGGLSLLSRSQPPIATLTWLLFVYAAAVLTPLAGVLAAADLLRRWWRNRRAANDGTVQDGTAQDGARIGS
ncbi:hypothetical protein [Arthrobacter sp. NPDC056493]|uniref:hypothetical protein n=1 Tax=Arthrobacter sp. NPDC056493 TaxID=3345839 RepID=UPI00366FE725